MKTETVGFRLNHNLLHRLDNMSRNLGNDRSKELTKLVERAVMDYEGSEDFARSMLKEAKKATKQGKSVEELLRICHELQDARTMIGHNHPYYRSLSYWKKRLESQVKG
jgi:predicted DNA-binding protein